MLRKKVALMIISIVYIVAFTGCTFQQANASASETNSKKQIKIIEDPNKEIYNTIALEKIDRYKDIRAMDWLDEDKLLAIKDNINLGKGSELDDGTKTYYKNIYLYNLKDKSEKLLLGEAFNHGNAQFSPDKKHIFYNRMENIDLSATGFIIQTDSNKSIKVTADNVVDSLEGRWTDNEHVIYPTMEGKIYLADVNGKSIELIDTKEKGISNVYKIGNKVYYIINGKVFVYDLDKKQSKTLKENVSWIIPSPDNTKLAMVRRTGENKMTLFITDFEGNEKASLAEGIQIFGTSWSSNGKNVAYTVTSGERGKNGLFVADVETKKITQLSPDMQDISDPIKWSISGKKMLFSYVAVEDGKRVFMTNVITLK